MVQEWFGCRLKPRSIGLRFTIAIWWFTVRTALVIHTKPLDGSIEAQPNGAVKTVRLKNPFHRAALVRLNHLGPTRQLKTETFP